jgi:hypothetical protein
MSYTALPLACYCGERPDRILEVGFTSDRNMVIHYWCSACSRVLFVSKALTECMQDCPPPQSEDALPQAASDDVRFLQSMGIVSPE